MKVVITGGPIGNKKVVMESANAKTTFGDLVELVEKQMEMENVAATYGCYLANKNAETGKFFPVGDEQPLTMTLQDSGMKLALVILRDRDEREKKIQSVRARHVEQEQKAFFEEEASARTSVETEETNTREELSGDCSNDEKMIVEREITQKKERQALEDEEASARTSSVVGPEETERSQLAKKLHEDAQYIEQLLAKFAEELKDLGEQEGTVRGDTEKEEDVQRSQLVDSEKQGAKNVEAFLAARDAVERDEEATRHSIVEPESAERSSLETGFQSGTKDLNDILEMKAHHEQSRSQFEQLETTARNANVESEQSSRKDLEALEHSAKHETLAAIAFTKMAKELATSEDRARQDIEGLEWTERGTVEQGQREDEAAILKAIQDRHERAVLEEEEESARASIISSQTTEWSADVDAPAPAALEVAKQKQQERETNEAAETLRKKVIASKVLQRFYRLLAARGIKRKKQAARQQEKTRPELSAQELDVEQKFAAQIVQRKFKSRLARQRLAALKADREAEEAEELRLATEQRKKEETVQRQKEAEAATVIVRASRRHLAKKTRHQRKERRIQSATRRKENHAAMTIQATYRGHRERRKSANVSRQHTPTSDSPNSDYPLPAATRAKQDNAALHIQTAWREYQDRKDSRDLRRKELRERREAAITKKEHEAAECIQRSYRQSVFRGKKRAEAAARAEALAKEEEARRQQNAACMIQAKWNLHNNVRGPTFKKNNTLLEEQATVQEKEHAELKLNRWMSACHRHHVAVKAVSEKREASKFTTMDQDELASNQEQNVAATRIQTQFRRVSAATSVQKMKEERRVAKRNKAAKVIQGFYARVKACRIVRQMAEELRASQTLLIQDEAAFVMQRAFRRSSSLRNRDARAAQRAVSARSVIEYESATLIQTQYRCRVAREERKRRQIEETERKRKEREDLEQNSARKIQFMVRRKFAERVVDARRRHVIQQEDAQELHEIIVDMQSKMRGFLARRRYLRQKGALALAKSMATIGRGFLARKEVYNLAQAQRAARTIQKRARMFIAKKAVGELRRKAKADALWLTRHRAAIMVQKQWRRCSAADYVSMLKELRGIQDISARKIQRCAKMFIAKVQLCRLREELDDEMEDLTITQGVIMMQALVRGHLGRVKAAAVKKHRDDAISLVASVGVGYQTRRFLCAKRDALRTAKAAECIQLGWRKHISIRAIRERQLQKRQYLEQIKKRENAAVMIQSRHRAYRERVRFAELKEKREKAAHKIQMKVRTLLAKKVAQSLREAMIMQKCARKIQARWVECRDRVREIREAQRLEQRLVQMELTSLLRHEQLKRTQFQQTEDDEFAALHIEYLHTMERLGEEYQERLAAWRARAPPELQAEAAVTIQAQMRGFVSRRRQLVEERQNGKRRMINLPSLPLDAQAASAQENAASSKSSSRLRREIAEGLRARNVVDDPSFGTASTSERLKVAKGGVRDDATLAVSATASAQLQQRREKEAAENRDKHQYDILGRPIKKTKKKGGDVSARRLPGSSLLLMQQAGDTNNDNDDQEDQDEPVSSKEEAEPAMMVMRKGGIVLESHWAEWLANHAPECNNRMFERLLQREIGARRRVVNEWELSTAAITTEMRHTHQQPSSPPRLSLQVTSATFPGPNRPEDEEDPTGTSVVQPAGKEFLPPIVRPIRNALPSVSLNLRTSGETDADAQERAFPKDKNAPKEDDTNVDWWLLPNDAKSKTIESEEQTMDLKNRRLTEVQLRPLLHALRSNTHVTNIDLSGNHLRDSSCVDIADVLQHNRTIERLSLANNTGISDVGITQIIAVLRSPHSQLRYLDVHGTCVTETYKMHIHRLLAQIHRQHKQQGDQHRSTSSSVGGTPTTTSFNTVGALTLPPRIGSAPAATATATATGRRASAVGTAAALTTSTSQQYSSKSGSTIKSLPMVAVQPPKKQTLLEEEEGRKRAGCDAT